MAGGLEVQRANSEGVTVANRTVSLLKRPRVLTFALSLDGKATSLPFGWVEIAVNPPV